MEEREGESERASREPVYLEIRLKGTTEAAVRCRLVCGTRRGIHKENKPPEALLIAR